MHIFGLEVLKLNPRLFIYLSILAQENIQNQIDFPLKSCTTPHQDCLKWSISSLNSYNNTWIKN